MDTSARVQDVGAPNISTIGEELTITGNVSSTGELHINGKIQGDVQCIALVLGENAQLDGDVVAEDVVRGRHRLGARTESDVAVPVPRRRQSLL